MIYFIAKNICEEYSQHCMFLCDFISLWSIKTILEMVYHKKIKFYSYSCLRLVQIMKHFLDVINLLCVFLFLETIYLSLKETKLKTLFIKKTRFRGRQMIF